MREISNKFSCLLGVVVLDRPDYDQGILKIINDASKFRPIKEDPTLLREGRLQRLLRKLKKDGHLDSEVYENIYPKGSQPARIYGLPKMHKDRGPNSAPPFRPIVSSIGTYNYNLAKYLCNLLSPHIPTEHCATDTFTFVQDIQSLSMFGKFMVSFDVESLFTNIPLGECIDLAVNYISEGNPDLKLSKSELRSLFTVATAQTHFLFNGSFYDQIDGVAMGSPLAPVLANLFMGHHEKLWLENFQGSKILFYRRYVDDTFCLFHSEHDATIFFDYINSRHPNIRFTMEKEAHHKLPFLDVLVNNNDPNSLLTSVYRKKTFTGLLTNYFSFTSYSYKVGLIRTLVDRAYKINNTWPGLHEDITKLMDILKKNLFPAHLIERVVNRYVTGTLSNHSPRVSLPSSPTFYFKLPYIGHFSVVTQKRVRHLIKRYCNDLDIKLVFSSFKIGNLFGVKDPIPGGLRSRVVYKFACAGCNACYVGETTRHFSTRVREHLVSDRASHIFKHLENSEHCHALCSVDCFHILDHASTTFQLKIKEAFHIRREQPSLNQQLHHVNLKLSF